MKMNTLDKLRKRTTPKASGFWITAQLDARTDLSMAEKFLMGRIDSLVNNKQVCTASGEFLAEQMQMTPGSVRNILSRLQQANLIIRLGQYRGMVERVIAPGYSRHPELTQQYIDAYCEANKVTL
jgi:DNA-binding MarR family transcriptional regulator